MKPLRRYWGFVALLAAIGCWALGGLRLGVIILILSLAAVVYFAADVPVWCGAVTRQGTLCRHNCSGVLRGCSLREHKWQKIKMTFVPKAWREMNRGLWASPRDGIATLAGAGSAVSALAAVVVIFVK